MKISHQNSEINQSLAYQFYRSETKIGLSLLFAIQDLCRIYDKDRVLALASHVLNVFDSFLFRKMRLSDVHVHIMATQIIAYRKNIDNIYSFLLRNVTFMKEKPKEGRKIIYQGKICRDVTIVKLISYPSKDNNHKSHPLYLNPYFEVKTIQTVKPKIDEKKPKTSQNIVERVPEINRFKTCGDKQKIHLDGDQARTNFRLALEKIEKIPRKEKIHNWLNQMADCKIKFEKVNKKIRDSNFAEGARRINFSKRIHNLPEYGGFKAGVIRHSRPKT